MAAVFTRRLILAAPIRTPDGAGGFEVEWEERGALWVDMRMRSGSFRQTEFGRTPRATFRMETHHVPVGEPMRPVPGDRLLDGERIFEVDAIDDSPRRTMQILATELIDNRR